MHTHTPPHTHTNTKHNDTHIHTHTYTNIHAGRALIAQGGVDGQKMGLTIAVRYACSRPQFGEKAIMEVQLFLEPARFKQIRQIQTNLHLI